MQKKIAVFALAALVLLSAFGCAKKNSYQQAAALMQSGDYDGAIAIYAELADYEDSAQLMEQCVLERDYLAARALYEAKDYENAEQALLLLNGYRDTAVMAAECRRILDERANYANAVALFEAGDYSAAWEAFIKMGDYEDCVLLAAKCENALGYALDYDGRTYYAAPLSIGNDSGGSVTLTVALNELVTIDIGEITLTMCPIGASVFVDGTEYVFSSYDVIDLPAQALAANASRACLFHFDTTGVPEKITLYVYLGDGTNGAVYEIDAAALI